MPGLRPAAHHCRVEVHVAAHERTRHGPGRRAVLRGGGTLLHTDWKADNVLIIADGRAWLVDWAWASRGAAWIDPALWAIWLIASGHSAEGANSLAGQHPAWDITPVKYIDAFAQAQEQRWESIARVDRPDEWTHKLHVAAQTWAQYRRGET